MDYRASPQSSKFVEQLDYSDPSLKPKSVSRNLYEYIVYANYIDDKLF